MIANTAPRILLVTAHCPHGPTYGAQLRTLHIARALNRCGDLGIAIFPFGPLSDECVRRTKDEFKVSGIFHLSEPACRSMASRLKREFDPYSADTEGKRLKEDDAERWEKLCKDYDLIWFQGVALPNCLGRREWPASVLDIDDVPSLCYAAMAREARSGSQRRRLVSAAEVMRAQLGRQVSLAAIQMHGAMGMTEECRVGHYAKRLMAIGQTLGDAHHHLRRFAEQAH